VAIAIVLFFISPKTCLAESPNIFVNELMWQGRSPKIADEWLELYNVSDQVVDLSGYYLTDEAVNPPKILVTIPVAGQSQIASHGTFLISKNARDFSYGGKESYLDVEPDIVDSGLVLSNTKLQIGLYDQDQNRIDIFGGNKKTDGVYDFTPYKPDCLIDPSSGVTLENMGTYCSLQRLDTFLPGDSPDSWENSIVEMILDPLIFPDGEKIFATPENSGRPEISNFILNNSGYKLSTELILDTSFDLSDSKADLDQIEISVDNSPDEVVLKFDSDKRIFEMGKFDYCPIINFSFIDKTGLSFNIEKELNCFKSAANVKFNEVMFRPKNVDWNNDTKFDLKDEWIELKNLGGETVELNGYVIEDLSGRQYKLSQSILADGYIILYGLETGLSLNDMGEVLYLKNPLGEIIDQVTIEKSDIYDISFSRFEDGWKFSQSATPSAANIFLWKQDPKAEVTKPVVELVVVESIPKEVITEVPIVEETIVVTEFKTEVTSPPLQLPDIELASISLPEVKGSKTRSVLYSVLYPSNMIRLLLYSFSILIFFLLIFLYEFYHRE
jgi:hypothetical protein